MRVQIVASLVILQLHSCAAAASGTGANTMVDVRSHHKVASDPSGFSGIHLSPVEGGVVTNPGTATVDKRVVSSGVPSIVPDWSSPEDCLSIYRRGAALPSSCYQGSFLPYETDPECGGCYGKRIVPTPPPVYGDFTSDCPIIGRRGDFLIRRCAEETTDIPVWKLRELDTMPRATEAANSK